MEQMSWLSETVKFFSGCDIYLYVKRLHTLIYLSYIFFTVGVGLCDGLGLGKVASSKRLYVHLLTAEMIMQYYLNSVG